MQQWRRKRGRFVITKQVHEVRREQPQLIEAPLTQNLLISRRPRAVRQLGALSFKLIATLVTLCVATIAMVGVGAWAAFTSTATASATYSSGTVTLALGATANPTNTLATSASGLAAGDTMQRTIDVLNNGTLGWSSLTFTTAATTSSLLDTDTTNGLQLNVDECSVAWSGGPAPTPYTCSGTTTPTVTSRAVIGSAISLGATTLTAGNTGHYRFTLTLPAASSTSTEGLSSTIQYTFTGTQRAATNK